ncbi:MAG TPA: UTP--glucose-1-phosphate uridylyltransferase, partial [bacterium]|nr:UTP--glucose-1-phosphate uridylyltransferase [bacterium]
IHDLPSSDQLHSYAPAGIAALGKTVVLKLNGGLGTSMGMTRAKSLLPAKNGLTFLEISARQVLRFRETHRTKVPLILMNSFRTRRDSLAVLAGFAALSAGLPEDFLQNKVPKVRADDLTPVEWKRDPEQEWCPPGHGDLYPALQSSGLLAELLQRGIEYMFVSNSDNLGAVLDLSILGWFAQERIPFLMEATDRTESDKKGGHLARRVQDGRLVLREVAQCPSAEMDEFQDITLYRYFNTNTLWLNLPALNAALSANEGALDLALIRNVKTVDPSDPSSPKVIQLETAMGAAISTFGGARALRVPRERFIPVKTTADLLALWSDLYGLDEDFRLTIAAGRRPGDLPIELDPRFYARIDQLEAHFPRGAPSLRKCTRLAVRGEVFFGEGVECRGDVRVVHEGKEPLHIPDGKVLS